MFPYRLGESQTHQGSVKEAFAQNVDGAEADRVPHPNMRNQQLPRVRIQTDSLHSQEQ